MKQTGLTISNRTCSRLGRTGVSPVLLAGCPTLCILCGEGGIIVSTQLDANSPLTLPSRVARTFLSANRARLQQLASRPSNEVTFHLNSSRSAVWTLTWIQTGSTIHAQAAIPRAESQPYLQTNNPDQQTRKCASDEGANHRHGCIAPIGSAFVGDGQD